MTDVVDLMDFENPDCKGCTDKTKRICGKTFDIDGPGKIGAIFTCENRSCRAIREAKNLFLVNSMRAEKEEPNE